MKKSLLVLCGTAFVLSACYSETNVREVKRQDRTIERETTTPVDTTRPQTPEEQ